MTEAAAIVFVVDDDGGMRQSLSNLIRSVGSPPGDGKDGSRLPRRVGADG
jgi:FixJ family two-component response regulator